MKNIKSYISANLLALSGWISLLMWIIFIFYVIFSPEVANNPSYGDGLAWMVILGVCANSAISAFFILAILVEYVMKESSPFLPKKETSKFNKIVSAKIYSIPFFAGIVLGLSPIILVLYVLIKAITNHY